MAGRVVCAILAAALSGGAQGREPAAEIVRIVRESVAAGRSDGGVAKALRKIHPAERVDERIVEELESAGAGPKTVAELEKISQESQSLPAPDPPLAFPHPPAPAPGEWQGIIDDAALKAINYTRSLPDFICTEKVRRYENTSGDWRVKDTLEVRLTYFERKEDYKLLTVNGRSAREDYRSVGGAITEGEFGTKLYSLFHANSATKFRWDHWTTLRRRPAYVFRFRIDLEHSTYRLEYRAGPSGSSYDALTGQHGLVYIDAESRQVVRIVSDVDSLPADFPVRAASSALDYGFVEVAGREYLLPLRAAMHMSTDRVQTRNLVEFHGYRKFAGQSKITFQ